MRCPFGKTAAIGILCFFVVAQSRADEAIVSNPYYKFWSSTTPGSTAVHVEKTKLSGPEGKVLPGGVDEKHIVYKLIEVTDHTAVVEMVVTERDFLGLVQAAPTRYIYPDKLEKSRLEHILLEDAGKSTEETLQVGGKAIKTRTRAGTINEPSGEQVEFKLWLSDDVPGSIVKQVRTAKQKGDLIAETTITLESFKKAR